MQFIKARMDLRILLYNQLTYYLYHTISISLHPLYLRWQTGAEPCHTPLTQTRVSLPTRLKPWLQLYVAVIPVGVCCTSTSPLRGSKRDGHPTPARKIYLYYVN